MFALNVVTIKHKSKISATVKFQKLKDTDQSLEISTLRLNNKRKIIIKSQCMSHIADPMRMIAQMSKKVAN